MAIRRAAPSKKTDNESSLVGPDADPRAIERHAEQHGKKAVPLLVKAVKSNSGRPRLTAFEHLARLDVDRAIDAVRDELKPLARGSDKALQKERKALLLRLLLSDTERGAAAFLGAGYVVPHGERSLFVDGLARAVCSSLAPLDPPAIAALLARAGFGPRSLSFSPTAGELALLRALARHPSSEVQTLAAGLVGDHLAWGDLSASWPLLSSLAMRMLTSMGPETHARALTILGAVEARIDEASFREIEATLLAMVSGDDPDRAAASGAWLARRYGPDLLSFLEKAGKRIDDARAVEILLLGDGCSAAAAYQALRPLADGAPGRKAVCEAIYRVELARDRVDPRWFESLAPHLDEDRVFHALLAKRSCVDAATAGRLRALALPAASRDRLAMITGEPGDQALDGELLAQLRQRLRSGDPWSILPLVGARCSPAALDELARMRREFDRFSTDIYIAVREIRRRAGG